MHNNGRYIKCIPHVLLLIRAKGHTAAQWLQKLLQFKIHFLFAKHCGDSLYWEKGAEVWVSYHLKSNKIYSYAFMYL